MRDERSLALRWALFLGGIQRGLAAEELHQFIENGLRMERLSTFIDEERRKMREAG